MMNIYTVLKCARALANKKAEERPDGGLKIKIDGEMVRVSYVELVEALNDFTESARDGNIVKVTKCKDCRAWSSAPNAKVGPCFPKEYTSSRKPTDYCSLCEKRD